MNNGKRFIVGCTTVLIAITSGVSGMLCRCRFVARYEAAKTSEAVGFLCMMTYIVVFPTD